MSFGSFKPDGEHLVDLARVRRLARHWVAYIGPRRLVGGAVSVLAVCIGGWLLVRPAPVPVEATMTKAVAGDPDQLLPTASTVAPVPLKVHVAGAVNKPGVYTLPAGSRVVDALRAAGGETPRADLERINLAQVIIDTEQVYIPSRRASAPRVTVAPRLRPVRNAVPTTTAPVSPSAAGGEPSTTSTERIDLNSATAAQLDSLPGVGPATARAIIGHRTRKGPFAKVEDLMNVTGIGPAKFAALRDLVTV